MITREYNIQAEGSLPYAKLKNCALCQKNTKKRYL